MAEVTYLLAKWGAEDDVLLRQSGPTAHRKRVMRAVEDVRHVLEGLKLEELEALNTSGYLPDKFNAWKSCAATGLNKLAEQRGSVAFVSCFKHGLSRRT